MITTTTNKISYISDGSATSYDFNFPVTETSDIQVYIYDLNDNKTQLVYGTDYSVSLNSDNSAGTITLTNPANKDYTVLIYREVPYTQETVYTENSPFPAKSHEKALDKLTLLSQQLQEKFDRTLQYDPADEGQSITLPPMVGGGFLGTTADKKLIWRANVDYSNINLKVNTISDLLNVDLTNWDGVQPFVVLILGYHEAGDGGVGVFYWDANEDKANHNGGTIIDPTKTFPTDWSDTSQQNSWFNTTNTGSGCWKRIYNGTVNIKWFGAKGNDITDDTKPLQKAVSIYTNIYTPEGVYKLSDTISTSITKEFYGDGKDLTLFKFYDNSGTPNNKYVFIFTASNVYIHDFGIDGQVSTSQTTVNVDNINSSNYDSWWGGKGIEVNSKNVIVERIYTQNTYQAGICSYSSSFITIKDCIVERCRGNFGDGVYIANSSGRYGTKILNNKISNITRIGIVMEDTNYYPLIENNYIENAHDASSLYGGTESNAFIWCEDTHGSVIKNNYGINSRFRGIVVSDNSTEYLNIVDSNYVKICNNTSDCVTGQVGISISSKNTKIINNTVYSNTGIHINNTDDLNTTIENNFIYAYANTTTYGGSILIYDTLQTEFAGGKVNISNNTLLLGNMSESYVGHITIHAYHNADYLISGNNTTDDYFKIMGTAKIKSISYLNQSNIYYICSTYPKDFTTFNNCTFYHINASTNRYNGSPSKLIVKNCIFTDALTNLHIIAVNNDTQISFDAILKRQLEIGIYNVDSTKKYILGDFHIIGQEDITNNSYLFRIQDISGDTNLAGYFFFISGEYYNTDGTSTSNSFIWLPHGGSYKYKEKIMKDDTVQYFMKTTSAINDTSDIIAVTLH